MSARLRPGVTPARAREEVEARIAEGEKLGDLARRRQSDTIIEDPALTLGTRDRLAASREDFLAWREKNDELLGGLFPEGGIPEPVPESKGLEMVDRGPGSTRPLLELLKEARKRQPPPFRPGAPNPLDVPLPQQELRERLYERDRLWRDLLNQLDQELSRLRGILEGLA